MRRNGVGDMAAPSPKRPKLEDACESESPISGVINPSLLSPENEAKLKAAFTTAEPYTHCVFREPFDADLLRCVREEIINNINATYKETDLFKVFQTGKCRRGPLAWVDWACLHHAYGHHCHMHA